MKLAIAGTCSVGKTLTTMAVSHLTGLPRSSAKTMRELLPISIPGKTLEECTPPELIMLIMRRNQERAVNESRLPDRFVSDGSSLHEWAYGTVQILLGINPDETVDLETIELTEEVAFYAKVLEQMAVPAKQHARATYDSFVHLPIEFPLVPDRRRPANERFRALADQLMLKTLDELNIPHHTVGGTMPERLQKITDIYGFTKVMSIDEAIEKAHAEYALISTRRQLARVA